MEEKRNNETKIESETNGVSVPEEQPAASKRKKRDSQKKNRHSQYVPSQLRSNRKTGAFIVTVVISILIVFSVAAAIIVSLKTVEATTQYVFDKPAHIYYAETDTSVRAGSTLDFDTDGNVTLTMGGTVQNATLPIYAEEDGKIVLPTDFAYYMPRTGERSRLVPITEIAYDGYDNLKITHGENSAARVLGFLHDGKDFYLFLEPMVLKFNNYTMTVPAYSYVEAVNKGNITVFNFETKQFFTEKSNGRATTASPASGDYTINLLGDSVTCGETRRLLISRPEVLDPIQ